MAMQNNLPTYAGLFGNIDFKEGDESRSVYSPAAYLVDLLQVLDDEYDPTSIDFSDRRGDVQDIDLDEENTNTLIPYLDIVNEILEGRIDPDQDEVYSQLKSAEYPFNMPFSLENEKIKNHLKHLGISSHELRRLFATDTDYTSVAREYLGLSQEELDAFIEPSETLTSDTLSDAYGYSGTASFVSALANLSTFLEKTDLEAAEVRQLLYQNLYIEPSDHTTVENGRENFYINRGLATSESDTYYSGYVTLSSDESTLQWTSLSNTSSTDTSIPLAWFDRASRFIRFAQKTGLSFTDLDHILRHCCEVVGVPTLSEETLLFIAQVIYLHKTLEQPVDTVVAILTSISPLGQSNEDLPQDQFNRIFNLPCVKVDKKYIDIGRLVDDQGNALGETPEQYEDTTYNDYSTITYYDDLFSDDNDDYRKRLRHTLGFTTTDLINITDRLEFEEVAESSLWESTANEWELLNILYRIHALSTALDVHFLELFTLFDLIEQDPFIGRYDPHTYFVYSTPDTQKSFEIFLGDSVNDQLWLFESLTALNKWMKDYGYSAEVLWKIVNGAPKTDKEEKEQDEQELALYNAMLEGFNAEELSPKSFSELGDARAADFAYSLVKHRCGYKNSMAYKKMSGMTADWLYEKNISRLINFRSLDQKELAGDFLRQLEHIDKGEFIGLSLGEKLEEKLIRNLIIHDIIDGEGAFINQDIMESGEATEENFSSEYDTSAINGPLYHLFHSIYMKSAEAVEEKSNIQVQIFKSDLHDIGLGTSEAKEIYDTLIFNGYINEEGIAAAPAMFADSDEKRLDLSVVTANMDAQLMQHVNHQISRFKASRVQLSSQMFAELELDSGAIDDLMVNLQQNGYIDEKMNIKNKMGIMAETPDTMRISARYYPQRNAIYGVFKGALNADKNMYLRINREQLKKYSNKIVASWVYQDLQTEYLDGREFEEDAREFFLDEEKRSEFMLRDYFDETQRNLVFDHLASIISYAKDFKLTDEELIQLNFDAEEIGGLKETLYDLGILNPDDVLDSTKAPFFKSPENADSFTVEGFEDYDREIFFALHDKAKKLSNTMSAVADALKEKAQAQQDAVLAQLEAAFGISKDAVTMLSKAIFKTQKDLHFAWLAPLFRSANVLNRLDHLPGDMLFTQSVKRIGQFAELIKKLQMDSNDIAIALEDQNLVAKFPEDLILPDDPDSGEQITSIDAILETEEFVYIFKDDYYWIYLSEDYTLIDKKEVVAGASDIDDDLLDLQKEDEARQKRLKEDPIRQLFDEEDLSYFDENENQHYIDAAFIDKYGTWCIVVGRNHFIRYADSENWDRRDNAFGQVDNDFENLEMIDAAYVDDEGRLFLFSNDKYVRYSDTAFTMDGSGTSQPSVDSGYPKIIAEDWNDENLPIQLPAEITRDLGPMFDGTDDHSYAFFGDMYLSSEGGEIQQVSDMWGHREYDFGEIENLDAAMTEDGAFLLFHEDKVVKYSGSIEFNTLEPEEGYPKPIHQHFDALPDEFVCNIDAALEGLDGNTYLFRDDDCVTIAEVEGHSTTNMVETNTQWGIIANDIADNGTVDAVFVGLDGRTYMFSGSQYVRYSGTDYTQVDDGFPRDIAEDWEGLTSVTAAFVLGNKTYLFGTNIEDENLYVRYSTVHLEEDDYLEVDEEDPNARTIETVLANRPDVDDIEVFPAVVNEEFWSLPESVTAGAEDFQIDAVMNGPDGKVYLFYGDNVIEHDHLNRWWSEPKVLTEQWDRVPSGLSSVVAGFTSRDGKTFLFFENKFLRFSDQELLKIDNGYPRPTHKYWGRVRNNIERTGQVDAALVVESRWEEQDKEGQLVDYVEDHTYLFSGDQFFRYKGTDYSTVEQGYPRHILRLKDEPRFRGLETDFPDGIDAAFADRRQVYLFKDQGFHAVIGDEDNYLHYRDSEYANIAAISEEKGQIYALNGDSNWVKFNNLDARTLTTTLATPRVIEKAEDALSASVSAVLHGTDNNSYVFADSMFYDVSLEKAFTISDVWGRSRNPIYDEETIDAAFVGRDGVTYVFSGEWFVQYDGDAGYIGQTVTYPPRRISSKFHGLNNVALAYVWKEETYLFERPDAQGNFHYLRYSKDSYEAADAGFPVMGDRGFWKIPRAYREEGFDHVDTIFVHEDNLIFISDQKFISFDLHSETWGYPRELELLYKGIPFNKTNFQDLKSGFVGADNKVYFFSDHCYVSYDETDDWTEPTEIKDDWGLQANIFSEGVDAAYVSPDGVTYLFAGADYVRYTPDFNESSATYRYMDAEYPKKIATYLTQEDDFAWMPKEFQQHLDEIEALDDDSPYFNGIVSNGRCVYVFTRDSLFSTAPDKYEQYSVEELGNVPNNFTSGGDVDTAFVDTENERTYLFSGEQYICYTGDNYRFIDEDYPKIISESLADDLGLGSDVELPESFRDGVDASFYLSSLGVVLFNERDYLAIDTGSSGVSSNAGTIENVWGQIENGFSSDDTTIDGAYIDENGALHVFKEDQFVRYSDTKELFALNPYNEMRYVDTEYPQDIREQWPHLAESILTDDGIGSVFKFEDQVYFHTGDDFISYALDLRDQYEENPVQVLAYRWGEWSDYLLSDILALSRLKDLGQRFSSGDLSLSTFVSGGKGEGKDRIKVKEPYMDFAAIFGFEKEDVRWVKQRNAFLASQVNVQEEEFNLELVLRLYDILATTQRIRVDVSSLYEDVWLPLYGSTADDRMQTAADGAYNALVQVDCDNNYEVLVDQITDELNVIKRDALVPYVIYKDQEQGEVSTTRALYQKLLIDIQMSSCAKTSRIKEATAAIQLYLHRCLVNLEDVDLDGSDQEAARETLKERWEWMQNYRVWEANRKVFLYPENYIRPELRDTDTKSAGFKALEESLTQGELTEEKVEEAYFKFLDAFTEVSELSIAGGYVFDDGDDKKVLLLGRTRTDPQRYFHRFGTFVDGSSASAVWDPWEPLEIPIEATRVEPVFAFNRVFIFWTTTEEVTSAEDAGSGSVTVTGDDTQTVTSSNNSTYEIKVFYSFYNLNKQWTQPQSLQTEFSGSSKVKSSHVYSETELFVENTTKLGTYADAYENIYIGVRFRYSGIATDFYAAYHLAPELYSVEATTQSIQNTGAELFEVLFEEGSIEDENVVMLNYNANSVDGPWFAYNHNGAGFLVKPDAVALTSSDGLSAIPADFILPDDADITAAVQMGTDGDVYFFFDNGNYTKRSVAQNGDVSFDDGVIKDRWGLVEGTEMQSSGRVDSAFVVGNNAYLSLDDEVYQYDYSDGDSLTGVDSPARLVMTPYALTSLEGFDVPSSWSGAGASFTIDDTTYLFEKGGTGVLRRETIVDFGIVNSNNVYQTTEHQLSDLFGLYDASGFSISSADVITVYNDTLHVISSGVHSVYNSDGTSSTSDDISVAGVLNTIFGTTVSGVTDGDYTTAAMIVTEDGIWIRGENSDSSSSSTNFVDASGTRQGTTPSNSFNGWDSYTDWVGGFVYDVGANTYQVTFHTISGGTRVVYSDITDTSPSTRDIDSVNVTGAFINGRGTLVTVIGNSQYKAARARSPSALANRLRFSTSSLSNLNLDDYLDLDAYLSLIGQSTTGIDAAFIGNGTQGVNGKLYLFIGEHYYRFSQSSSDSFSNVADEDYPQRIDANTDDLPIMPRVDAAFTSPSVDGAVDSGITYFFYNGDGGDVDPYYYDSTMDSLSSNTATANVWGVEVLTRLQLQDVPTINAAYFYNNVLYLFTEEEYYTYTLNTEGNLEQYIDNDQPLQAPGEIDAAFSQNGYTYLFSGQNYYRAADGTAPSAFSFSSTIAGNWGNLPADIRSDGLDAAFTYTVTGANNTETQVLYLMQGSNYISYELSNAAAAHPYEIQSVDYEVIRLTSSTAEKLNQILFADGVDGLLQMSTQEINESPTISKEDSSPDNIQMSGDRFTSEPSNSHLDFHSANGLYYWEVFFHAPFLIAQTLNADQKFEDAKTWYEYIYDPTRVADYWKFLPFLAADPDALLLTLSDDLSNFEALTPETEINSSGEEVETAAWTAIQNARTAQSDLATALSDYQAQEIFLGTADKDTIEAGMEDDDKLANIENWSTYEAMNTAITALDTSAASAASDNTLLATWQSEMQEVMAIIARMDYRIKLMRNYKSQLSEYLDDPFDPHAIAALRPLAYRKAIVMRYVDNLLDWGDMLFRQYTRESINEARMLYVFAYDLLGEKPENMGQVTLSDTKTYADFDHFTSSSEEDYNFLIDFENSASTNADVYEQGLSFAATQFDTITNPYFYLKENELFTEYWDRVEDRLDKIRNCLNIDGVAVPLPLFQPPIDPMALVNAAASGGVGAAAAAAASMAMVPDHRFTTLTQWSKELTAKLKGFSDGLLSTLEKKDAEELSLMQGKFEAAILDLTTELKEESILEAHNTLANLNETKNSAQSQYDHYNDLINTGYLPEEITQLAMMGTAAVLHGGSALGKYISGLSYIVPQFTAGPFSFGVTTGGENIGAMLQQFGEAIQSGAEALSMGGEIAGVAAQFKRSAQDWELQRTMASSELKQLDEQIKAQENRLKITKQELILHKKEIDNQQSISDFMKSKFSNVQLYSWMSGKIAGLFFQTYKLAHDYAKQAEQAFIFEKGVAAGEVNYVNGAYWNSQKKGLMAGETLELDLDKMEKAYRESDSRGLEITKNISLLELDPLALMELKNTGSCTFRLTEAMFDYDFPGHYNRQIKTISLAFDAGEGSQVNATLTQLSNMQVLEPDIKAVKHLLDPANEATDKVRANWRANQQIALSHVDQYTENNGMFELNFGDERYLPFEGTGAVSNWRLELSNNKDTYNPADLLDVTIKLRYTAMQGGKRFATEVKGVLKPYHATSFFDLAYNFPDQWAALVNGETDTVDITFTADMFPRMSSSKIIGLFIHYEYEGSSGATFTVNDDLPVPNDTYLQPSTLSVGKNGASWSFTLKGDRTTLKNAEMVLVYKAQI